MVKFTSNIDLTAIGTTAPVAAGTIETSILPGLSTEFIGLAEHNTLVAFDPNNPALVESTTVTGIEGTLLGIDTRPANGLIYGVSDTNNIYTIDPDSGTATYVSTLNTPFEAREISGFDFNPVADRLRLVGNNDQDFRINVDTGQVTVDGTLAFAEGDLNYGVDPNISAAGYTNSFDGTTSTQLYDIDPVLDSLVLQNPPNDGTLVTVGHLGVDFEHIAGFDIVSAPDGTNTAFAVSNSNLYAIDLSSGVALDLGDIGGDQHFNFQGLATRAVIPSVAANSRFITLTDNNTLVAFDPNSPSQTESVEVTGVEGFLLGIDTRPANGLIYGISTANKIYTIDPQSGAATYVSTLNTAFEGGTISGFDFNPAADRLRLVGDNDQNFRINVDTGEVTVDGVLSFAAGDLNQDINPNITAAGYTNSFDGTTSTQLYNIDTLLNQLVRQDPPNDGTLVTVGDLGIDFDTLGGFDIVSSPDGNNAAFAVSNSTLYSIDLSSGTAISLGAIGSGDQSNLQGLAVVDNWESNTGLDTGETDCDCI